MSDLLTRDRLVFKQKTKIIEMNQHFKIKDEEGNEIGDIVQEGQSKLKKFVRLVGDVDQFFTHTLSVYDSAGTKVIELTRPRKVVKSRVIVKDGSGGEVGQIVQQNVFGKIRFDLEDTSGQSLGMIKAENWRAWNFSIVDPTDREIGRITKKWEGLARTMFTTADHYMLEVEPSVQGKLRLFAIASACAIDLALKQDSRGLS
jgi:uncharacterized protein YxjI